MLGRLCSFEVPNNVLQAHTDEFQVLQHRRQDFTTILGARSGLQSKADVRLLRRIAGKIGKA